MFGVGFCSVLIEALFKFTGTCTCSAQHSSVWVAGNCATCASNSVWYGAVNVLTGVAAGACVGGRVAIESGITCRASGVSTETGCMVGGRTIGVCADGGGDANAIVGVGGGT